MGIERIIRHHNLNMKSLFFIAFSVLFTIGLSAQISLDNPSFEGEAQDATMPRGWLQCKVGTTPDILPGSWGVYNEPSDGDTYMGLITRADKTWESVGQRLSQPLEGKLCYEMSVDLAHSKTYTGYNRPVKLKVWAGKTRCSRGQLLWESDNIKHADWKTYEFNFTPNGLYNYIIFEAYFPGDRVVPYKGNILIDNISQITVCKRA